MGRLTHETNRSMQHDSYKAITATPAAQSQFLETVAADMAGMDKDLDRRAYLSKVTVAGKPFSIAMFCSAVDVSSQDWDIDEDDVELHRFVRAVKQVEAVYPEFKPSGFVFNFHKMPGADAPAPVVEKKAESTVSFQLMGSPSLGKGLLSGSTGPERVNVSTHVHNDGARRVMRLS